MKAKYFDAKCKYSREEWGRNGHHTNGEKQLIPESPKSVQTVDRLVYMFTNRL